LAAVLTAAALAACAPQQSGDVLPSSQALTASEVQYGVVTGSRPVELRNMGQADGALGAVVGGVAGAAAGQQVGGGTGRVLATGAGAVAGAALGQRAGQAIGRAQSIEWFVRLEDGRNISVVQGEPQFGVGQRVRVISGNGSTRLAPA
jgi:outer membrane lipoprotein SlyB